MQGITRKAQRCSKVRTRAGWTVLALLLSLLAGCATGGKVQPEPVEQPPPVAEGPSVTRLADGREGFVIREISEMDAESRGEFERAIELMKERDFEGAVELLEKVIEGAPGVTAPYIDIA